MKKIWVQKNLCLIFITEFFVSKKWVRKFWPQKIFLRRFSVRKNFMSKEILVQEKLWDRLKLQKVFGSWWYTVSLVSCFVRSLSPRLEQAEQLLVKKSMDEYAFIDIFQTSFTVSTIQINFDSTIKLSHTLENSPALL